jgi:peptidoglycan hydrolase-like protein with peptidoglycan-binding domain
MLKTKLSQYKILLVVAFLLMPFLFVYPATAAYTKCRKPHLSVNKFCFKLGDRGAYIEKISSILDEIGYYRGKPTAIFNKKIERSVIKFQQDYRLSSSDGIVGNETLLHMCKVRGKGCKPDADNGCYTGSPRFVVSCLNDFRSEAEKDRAYFNK